MKYISKGIKTGMLLAIGAIAILSSCNKDVTQPTSPVPIASTLPYLGPTIAAIPNDSLYYKLIVRAGSGLLNMISTKANSKDTVYTMFVPDNNAMRVYINLISFGAVPINAPDPVFVGFINTAISPANAYSIVSYNMIPQAIKTSNIPSTFPNWFYPTNLNPTTGTPGFNPLVRLTTAPSVTNGNWVNNVPLSQVNLVANNGIIHTAAAMPGPPSRVLYQRIAADADMTIFNAALTRADSGIAATGPASLIWALSNFGPNLTVFVPTNLAMKQTLSALTGIPVVAPDAVFIGFLGSNLISTQQVKGIVVYHMMGVRSFTNNFPTTAAFFPTLLNGGIPTHPGVSLSVSFTANQVSAASVKGVANLTASNILINPLPEPNGTSDQHYVNGTLHKINQVLLPQ